MPLRDLIRRRPAPDPGSSFIREELAEAARQNAALRAEDQGWAPLGTEGGDMFTLDALKRAAADGRALAVAHPLVRRGLSLRTAYVHGNGGPQVTVDYDGDQDVAELVATWWQSAETQGALAGPEAAARLERTLSTDGNVYIACFTNPRTGTVVVRTVPFEDIVETITNPEDRREVWFYRRRYTARTFIDGSTRTRESTREVLHPALSYSPTQRPSSIDGVEVRWGERIRHVLINDLEGWQYGIGDTFAIAPYARAYRDFLGDWVKLMRSLSTFAWRLTADGKRQRNARRAVADAAARGATGDAVVQDVTENIEAIPKSGATIDADSGRPLLAMIAAGLDVPVTMLSTDPGVTGARATAETLDRPMLLSMASRRDVWTAVYQDLAGYVIEQAITAPQGPIRGDVVADPWTRTDSAIIDGVAPTIHVEWPDLRTESVDVMVKAIADANTTGKLPPLTLARLLLTALGVDDIETVMAELQNDDGTWRDPYGALGPGIVDAFNAGDDPAQALARYGAAVTAGDVAAAEAVLRGDT